MCTVIDDQEDIKKYQDIFVKIFQFNSNKYEDISKYEDIRIGFHGGAEKCDVYWSSKFEFWSASNKLTKGGNRYRNWFGFTNPENKNNLSVDIEISISISGNRTAGKFVRNGNTILITHNGDFRKNRKSIKDTFINHCKNSKSWKIINIDGEELVIIAELPYAEIKYSDFKNKVGNFIKEAFKIKNNANGKKIIKKNVQRKNNVNSKNSMSVKKKNADQNKTIHQFIPDDKQEIINKAFKIILPVFVMLTLNLEFLSQANKVC